MTGGFVARTERFGNTIKQINSSKGETRKGFEMDKAKIGAGL